MINPTEQDFIKLLYDNDPSGYLKMATVEYKEVNLAEVEIRNMKRHDFELSLEIGVTGTTIEMCAEYTVSGKHLHSTLTDPEELPEVEIINIYEYKMVDKRITVIPTELDRYFTEEMWRDLREDICQ